MCAAVALAVGTSVLVGWALHIPILLNWIPGYVTQKANTASCFVLGASALFALRGPSHDPRRRRIAAICATIMVVVSGLSLAEYVFGWNLGIDQLLVHDPAWGSGTSHPGRMAPNTAFEFVLIGMALHATRTDTERARRVAQACTFVAMFFVLAALVGYLYRAHVLVGLFSLTRMAVHTIVGMLALCLGTLGLTAKGGWLAEVTALGSGRVVARRLLPAALVVPIGVGLITLSGYRAGLYDPAFGAALMAVVETVSFATLVWLCARSLNESERGRSMAGQDELTGLLNRRGFLDQGELRKASARRRGEDALILFIDMDGMKGINDAFGHAAGDRALVEAAGVLRTTFRETDVVARLGGDEFAVFAAKATMESAPWMLSRLETHLTRINAEPGRDFALSLSTGVTPCLALETGSIADLLKRADARMYEQKEAKRPEAGQESSRNRRWAG